MAEIKTSQNSTQNIPSSKQVVIIGGGVISCSIASHLAKLGWKDILLLEHSQPTAGTTWHAASLVEAGGIYDCTKIELAQHTRELYQHLESETGIRFHTPEGARLELCSS